MLAAKEIRPAGGIMAPDGSVSRLIDGLVVGDAAAVQQVWERYFRRLVGLARKHLQDRPRAVADEEDVALSAFDSFCRNAEAGRFPEMLDRDGLWRLLVVITVRKAAHLVRDQGRLRRGGLAEREGSPLVLEEVLSREPTPEVAALAADEHRRLLRLLGDRDLESIAVWRMEGFSVEEIAGRLGCAPRSVKRKLQLIRAIWQQEEIP
jgi:DNA-directed RNA polymerase specialized sigma24 family protein